MPGLQVQGDLLKGKNSMVNIIRNPNDGYLFMGVKELLKALKKAIRKILDRKPK